MAKVKIINISQVAKNIMATEQKLATKIATEAAEEARAYAEDRYWDAEYDGETPDITVDVIKDKSGDVLVRATGDAVLFIEYGTGEYVGHTSKKTGHPYWFYTLPEDYSFGTEDGDFAHYWRNKKDENGDPMYYIKEKNKKKGTLMTEGEFENRFEEKFDTMTPKEARKFMTENKAKEWVEKKNSGFTRGNPAQHIMADALIKAQDYIKDKYKAK